MSQDSSLMPFLETLDLSYNEITDLGAGYISALFRQRDIGSSKCFRELGMRSNKVQNLGVCLLASETSCCTLLDFRGILSDDLSAAWLLSAIKSGKNVGRCKFDEDDVVSTRLSGIKVPHELVTGLATDHSLISNFNYAEWERCSKIECEKLSAEAASMIKQLTEDMTVPHVGVATN
jgi:Leucine-rich repeat (LRR) protein